MNSKIFLKIFFKLTGLLLVYHVFQLCFYEVSVCVCVYTFLMLFVSLLCFLVFYPCLFLFLFY